MAVLQSFATAVRTVLKTPLLLAIGLAFGLTQSLLVVTQQYPTLNLVVSVVWNLGFLFVLPFFQGGLITTADRAFNRQPSLSIFLNGGKRHYVRLFFAYLILIGVSVLFGLATLLLLAIGFVTLVVLPVEGGVSVVVLGVAVVALFFSYLLFTALIQFYAHAIVLDDTELVSAFARSLSVVRQNILSVTGYTLLLAVGGAGFGLLAGIISLLFAPTENPFSLSPVSFGFQIGGTIALIGMTAVFVALYATYSTVFYRELTRKESPT
ncbi:hypothetical protein HUB97_06795 [Halorubraceae archaeon YAN]|nr:hypothetical protein [Halorubraceae archaeon YAN]